MILSSDFNHRIIVALIYKLVHFNGIAQTES